MDLEQAFVLRMTNDCLERSDAATRDAGTAGRPATAASGARLGSLSVLHIGLHLFDIGNFQMLHDTFSEQRDDVRLYATLVHVER